MTMRDDKLEQLLTDWLEDDVHVAPSSPVDAAIEFARAHPRRRAWFSVATRDVLAPSPPTLRYALLLAALGALIALTAGSIVNLGSSLRQDSPARPQPTDPVHVGQVPGSPLPEELLGSWDERDGSRTWQFHAAGDPMCAEFISTDQDCVVFEINGERQGGGIVAVEGDTLLYDETRESRFYREGPPNDPCWAIDAIEAFQFRISGGRLFLQSEERCWPNDDIASPLLR